MFSLNFILENFKLSYNYTTHIFYNLNKDFDEIKINTKYTELA